jgi:hypothetical protein
MKQRSLYIDGATFRGGGLCVVANCIGCNNHRVARYPSAPAKINIIAEEL